MKKRNYLNIEQGNQGEGDSYPAASEHVGVLRELGLTLPADEALGVGADVVPVQEPSQAQKDSRQPPTNEGIGFGQSTNHTLSYGPGGITVNHDLKNQGYITKGREFIIYKVKCLLTAGRVVKKG